jgi:DNA modification methylase
VSALRLATGSDYEQFLVSKRLVSHGRGLEVTPENLDPVLFDFQRDVTAWALRKGRAALFLDTGLGKTPCQLEWARVVRSQAGAVLIVAPLSVAEQTIREAHKLALTAPTYLREPPGHAAGVFITNYEHAHKWADFPLAGLVLDESSRLAAEDSKTRKLMCERFGHVPYRLACTATPIPNDVAEICNHAEFLGVMTRRDVLGAFFVHDEDGWRLRGHAREPFFRWVASWAMCMKTPADLDYDGSRYALPPLSVTEHFVEASYVPEGQLFAGKLKGISDRARVRAETVVPRAEVAAKLAAGAGGPVIVWCDRNDESAAVTALLPDAIEVRGNHSPEEKRNRIIGFIDGTHRVLVSKPRIAGFGLNLQNCSTQVFCGLTDSWQFYYQAIRRSWRFGQTSPVDVHVVVSEPEREIVANVRRKETEAEKLARGLVAAARRYELEELGRMTSETTDVERATYEGASWRIEQGDCVEVMRQMDADSVDLSVFSPPFLALYTYTDSERDMGNCAGEDEFFRHFRFFVAELLRVTKPGRNAAVHVAQVAATLNHDGFIGIKDFRARVVEAFVSGGWVYHGEVVVDKNPQAQAIRTHAKGLLFVQKEKDSSWLRPALADYVLVFRKPGDNAVPVRSDVTNDEWIQWARPVWYSIRESDTLNVAEARADEDDRHVCPLQLDLIERCVRLWSNRGETVLDPFAGIGSTPYVAVLHGRYGLGIELKDLYAQTAVRNMGRAEAELNQVTLFDPQPKEGNHALDPS